MSFVYVWVFVLFYCHIILNIPSRCDMTKGEQNNPHDIHKVIAYSVFRIDSNTVHIGLTLRYMEWHKPRAESKEGYFSHKVK